MSSGLLSGLYSAPPCWACRQLFGRLPVGHAAKSTDRRLAQSAEQSGRSEVVNALRNQRGIAEFSSPLLRRINDLITQSGLQVTRNTLIFTMLAGSAFLFVIWALVFGRGIASGFLAIASMLLITFAFFHRIRERRIARFAELLPDSIDVMVRAIRVGYPLPETCAEPSVTRNAQSRRL